MTQINKKIIKNNKQKTEENKQKEIIGLIEKIRIYSNNKKEFSKLIRAKIDTGAENSSIDSKLASKLHLGPIVKTKSVKSGLGKARRIIVHATVLIKGQKVKAEFTISDRSHLKYPVLIGVNILKKLNIYIDPNKEIQSKKEQQ